MKQPVFKHFHLSRSDKTRRRPSMPDHSQSKEAAKSGASVFRRISLNPVKCTDGAFPQILHNQKLIKSVLFLTFAFFLGAGAGKFSHHQKIRTVNSTAVIQASSTAESNWGLSFPENGKPPVANTTAEALKAYDAYYIDEAGEKVIYLTFDAGYENGNTPAILDALKKHNAPATFFLVGNYITTSPDLVKRMVEEGHTIGNHTYHHPNMSQISTEEAFSKELNDLEALCQQTTGQPMSKFYRPPQGKYSETNLTMAKKLGYKTFFWSLAYVDWYEDKQPTKEEAFNKLLNRIHPGAIVLLHSTSKTNGEILDELLTKWEEMGYTFRSLEQLVQEEGNAS